MHTGLNWGQSGPKVAHLEDRKVPKSVSNYA